MGGNKCIKKRNAYHVATMYFKERTPFVKKGGKPRPSESLKLRLRTWLQTLCILYPPFHFLCSSFNVQRFNYNSFLFCFFKFFLVNHLFNSFFPNLIFPPYSSIFPRCFTLSLTIFLELHSKKCSRLPTTNR